MPRKKRGNTGNNWGNTLFWRGYLLSRIFRLLGRKRRLGRHLAHFPATSSLLVKKEGSTAPQHTPRDGVRKKRVKPPAHAHIHQGIVRSKKKSLAPVLSHPHQEVSRSKISNAHQAESSLEKDELRGGIPNLSPRGGRRLRQPRTGTMLVKYEWTLEER